jgi:hypothetical protein
MTTLLLVGLSGTYFILQNDYFAFWNTIRYGPFGILSDTDQTATEDTVTSIKYLFLNLSLFPCDGQPVGMSLEFDYTAKWVDDVSRLLCIQSQYSLLFQPSLEMPFPPTEHASMHAHTRAHTHIYTHLTKYTYNA